MPALKLIALDADDLAVVSAHLQDAEVVAGDLAYLEAERQFVILARRREGEGRALSGIRFDKVDKVERLAVPLEDPARMLTLVGALFQPTEAPAGRVLLLFAEGRSIRLSVECIEVVMADLAPPPAAPTKD